MWRWLVIIARDRPELWLTWATLYGGAGRLEIRFDRRQERPWIGRETGRDRRAASGGEPDLNTRGFLVIAQPELLGASRT